MSDRMFMPEVVFKWSSLQFLVDGEARNISANSAPWEGSIGFIPVFKDRKLVESQFSNSIAELASDSGWSDENNE